MEEFLASVSMCEVQYNEISEINEDTRKLMSKRIRKDWN
jgi:hypothetical protein